MVKLKMKSNEDISKDDLIVFEVFMNDIQLKDLLVFQKIIATELDHRIQRIDKRNYTPAAT